MIPKSFVIFPHAFQPSIETHFCIRSWQFYWEDQSRTIIFAIIYNRPSYFVWYIYKFFAAFLIVWKIYQHILHHFVTQLQRNHEKSQFCHSIFPGAMMLLTKSSYGDLQKCCKFLMENSTLVNCGIVVINSNAIEFLHENHLCFWHNLESLPFHILVHFPAIQHHCNLEHFYQKMCWPQNQKCMKEFSMRLFRYARGLL